MWSFGVCESDVFVLQEMAVLSLNAYLHLWDIEAFQQVRPDLCFFVVVVVGFDLNLMCLKVKVQGF